MATQQVAAGSCHNPTEGRPLVSHRERPAFSICSRPELSHYYLPSWFSGFFFLFFFFSRHTFLPCFFFVFFSSYSSLEFFFLFFFFSDGLLPIQSPTTHREPVGPETRGFDRIFTCDFTFTSSKDFRCFPVRFAWHQISLHKPYSLTQVLFLQLRNLFLATGFSTSNHVLPRKREKKP